LRNGVSESLLESVDSRSLTCFTQLFNATAVMESRVSTHIGENVALLTCLSIFFLPLAFCMVSIPYRFSLSAKLLTSRFLQSVWSVNDTLLSTKALAIVTPLFAIATYLVAFNLKNLVKRWQKMYQSYVRTIVHQMNGDTDMEWINRGVEFEKLSNRPGFGGKPSNWRPVQYLLKRYL
jgi:hypothetical protein